MRTQDVVHAVYFQELLDHLRTECVSCSSWTQAEFISFAVRIRPHQISHGTLVGNFPESIDDLDLVNAVNARAQAAMDAEDFVVDNAGKTEVVEHIRKVVPYSRIAVLSTAFGVEAI